MSQSKGWSYEVTHRVPSTFPPYGLYTQSAEAIYKSMRRPEVSPKGLASAIQMCQFYINRAGRSLPQERKEELKKAIAYLQTELRYRNSQLGHKTPGSMEQHESDWHRLTTKIDLNGEPEPAMGPNPYLAQIVAMQQEKMEAKAQGLKKFAGAMVPIGKARKVHNFDDAFAKLFMKIIGTAAKKVAIKDGLMLGGAATAGSAAYGANKLYKKYHTKKAGLGSFGIATIGKAHVVENHAKLAPAAKGMFSKMLKGKGVQNLAIGSTSNKYLQKATKLIK